MSTPNTVKAQLQNLIDIANRVTGKSDIDLTGAVNTLVNERETLINGSITEVYSEVEIISDYAFARRKKMINVHLPNVIDVSAASFYNDECLKNIIIPKVEKVRGSAFSGCLALEYIDLANCSEINYNAFTNCSSLRCVILRKTDKICYASGLDVFSGTKIVLGTGYIYVPRTLIDSYKTATNWTAFAAQFRVLEDYTVDGTITGELDWNKVNGGSV